MKAVTLKFTPQQFDRGSLGSEFYTTSLRFPIKVAQGFERRCRLLGLSMSALATQLVMALNAGLPIPAGTKLPLAQTKEPNVTPEMHRASVAKSRKAKAAKAAKEKAEKTKSQKVKLVVTEAAPKKRSTTRTTSALRKVKQASPKVKKLSAVAATLAKIRKEAA